MNPTNVAPKLKNFSPIHRHTPTETNGDRHFFYLTCIEFAVGRRDGITGAQVRAIVGGVGVTRCRPVGALGMHNGYRGFLRVASSPTAKCRTPRWGWRRRSPPKVARNQKSSPADPVYPVHPVPKISHRFSPEISHVGTSERSDKTEREANQSKTQRLKNEISPKNTFQKSFVLFRVLLWLKKSFSLALPILYALCGFFFAPSRLRVRFFLAACAPPKRRTGNIVISHLPPHAVTECLHLSQHLLAKYVLASSVVQR
jgi:hypothetical protein